MKRLAKIIGAVIFLGTVVTSCTTLKPYERVYVDDPEMQMSVTADKEFKNYTQSIRESSVTANGPKGNGGCGCN